MARAFTDHDRLLRILVEPHSVVEASDRDWDVMLPQARRSKLLARIAAKAEEDGLSRHLPQRVRSHLVAAANLASHHHRTVLWEINRIEHALKRLKLPIMLLKGAAYLTAGLPPAKGRLAGDVDIMVPRQSLDAVEAALKAAGWQLTTPDAYSQHYYRRWMHELPPLRHRDRGSVIDVHHAILPPTARLKPDTTKLWETAWRLDHGPIHLLAPADMVLHSATHLFHDGDLQWALRDLVDISDLLTHFGQDPQFWPYLVQRATALNLGRPLFYAFRYCRALLSNPIPATAMVAVAASAPPSPVLALMDRLVPRVLIPAFNNGGMADLAPLMLYVRSHWLRMPLPLLARHLTHQLLTRLAGRGELDL